MKRDSVLVIPPVAYIGYPTIECATLCAILSKYGIQVEVVELNLTLLRYFMKNYGKKLKNTLRKKYGSNPQLELNYIEKIAEILDYEENHQYMATVIVVTK